MVVIPNTLIRTVPSDTTGDVEMFWQHACDLHPDWSHITYRDPIDPTLFPRTAPSWAACTSGAQLAGLIRLEALLNHGGHYLDSDVDLYRPLTPLSPLDCYAAWEDPAVVPDAVIGAVANHPAIEACLSLALNRLHGSSTDWRTGSGAWSTGPGVTTTVFPGRPDVLLLPPGSFYPVHYSSKTKVDWSAVKDANPWSFGAHRWHASWVTGG